MYMWNSMMMFTFSVFKDKHLSWVKLLQKFKMKYNTKTDSNMQNQMVLSILSVLD